MEELIEIPEITPAVPLNICPVCDRAADQMLLLSSVPEVLSPYLSALCRVIQQGPEPT